MRSNRLYIPCDLEPGARLSLPESTARHAAQVLRLRAGDPVVVFDGRGAEHDARVEIVAKRGVEVTVGAARTPVDESPLAIVLAQGIARGERMDLVVQKAVELGVAAIQPLVTQRSVVRLDARRAAARMAHWQAVAAAACEQSGRATVPRIGPITELRTWLDARDPEGMALVLDPRSGDSPCALAAPTARVTVLVGPEGGLDEAESAAARRAGFTPVRLGPRILRTETAALAALGAVQLLWGDLGGA